MRELNIDDWERHKTYLWFKNFSNSTYSMNVRMDVTKLVEHTKKRHESFYIDLLYILIKSLDGVEEMRMRLVNDRPVIYEPAEITPAYTVMTNTGTFENVRHPRGACFEGFYGIASEVIENAKKQTSIKKEDYNPEHRYNEYYVTCVPWVDFTQFTHPIPDNQASQCIPRICWGKYVNHNGRYELTMNITVSHIFVDGYPLSQAFRKIQELLDNPTESLC